MSGLICWCGDGLHVENETPFCDSCGTVYSCVEQAKKATTKTIERNTLFLQSKNVGLKLADQAKTIAAQQQVLNGLAEMLGVEAGDVDGLITRVEWVRKDAERYQWLKDKRMFRMFSADMSGKHTYTTAGRPIGSGRNIDEAIDAEIDKALAGGEAG